MRVRACINMWLGAYVEDEVDGNGYEIEKDDERGRCCETLWASRDRIGGKQIDINTFLNTFVLIIDNFLL